MICQTGGSVTLQANITPLASQSFQWLSSTTGTPTSNATGSSTSSIYLANPSVTTNYALSNNLTPFGCSTPLTTSQIFGVGVISPLAINPTATPSSVCLGDPSDLSANLPAGNFTATCITPVTSLSTPPINAITLVANNALTSSSSWTPVGVTTLVTQTIQNSWFDDSYWSNVPIGFHFNFFDSLASKVFIGSNGTVVIGVNGAAGSAQYDFTGPPQGFPSTANPASTIAVCARDLRWDTGNGTIKYWTEGIAPTRRFFVQYANASTYSYSGSQSAEMVLYETTGVIDIRVISATNGTWISVNNNGQSNSIKKYFICI